MNPPVRFAVVVLHGERLAGANERDGIAESRLLSNLLARSPVGVALCVARDRAPLTGVRPDTLAPAEQEDLTTIAEETGDDGGCILV